MTDANSTKRIQKKEDFLIIMNQIRLFDAKDVSLVSLELHTPEILKEQKQKLTDSKECQKNTEFLCWKSL